MTDKERLKDIKRMTGAPINNNFILHTWFKHGEWLIEQAEKVWQAEEDVRLIEIKIGETYEKNIKLREALGRIASKDWTNKPNYDKYEACNIAQKALEELK